MSVKVDREVEEALKQGKLVIVMGKCDAKFRIKPEDKVKVIVRE
jgi:hypothetical protein